MIMRLSGHPIFCTASKQALAKSRALGFASPTSSEANITNRRAMKELEYGKNYKYAHNYTGNFVNQQYLPNELKDNNWWKPQDNVAENKLKDHLNKLWKDRYK